MAEKSLLSIPIHGKNFPDSLLIDINEQIEFITSSANVSKTIEEGEHFIDKKLAEVQLKPLREQLKNRASRLHYK